MSELFLASDLHFSHHRILEFEPIARPFDTIEKHDQALISRWNSTVSPSDIVWVLGDLAFNTGLDHLDKLNGVFELLILGNHDWKHIQRYLRYFNKVHAMKEKYNLLFTHIPIHPDELDYRWKGNVHGHLHSRKINDKRYLNISLEHTNLRPIHMSEVLDRFKKQYYGDIIL